MCGIVGIAGGDDCWIESAMGALRHRGPDASGLRRFDGCTLGHTRLRVIDLDPVADQPLSNEDGSVWVVFNGELYNHRELRDRLERAGHRFRSSSDTEVLVHLYEERGDALVDDLRGMFAFGLWDDRRRRLVLARDRLGIKPLYLRPEPNGGLAFASEMQALRRLGDGLDDEALSGFLQLGWVTGPQTLVSGIEELPPAHLVVWADNDLIVRRRYWVPPYGRPGELEPGELRSVLADSVHRHLVADVPVGIFLSSGVDSSVLAVLAAQDQVDLEAFTVTFPGFENDEGPAAARFARRLGLRHSNVALDEAEVRSAVPLAVADLDQPSVDGINTWFVARAVRDRGTVVALSGVGGDELFFGYSTFRHAPRIARLPLPPSVPRSAHAVSGYIPRLRNHRFRRAAAAAATRDLGRAYTAVRGLFPIAELDRLRPGVSHHQVRVEEPWPVPRDDRVAVGALELANYLPHQLLRDTDVMGMAHSLEVRTPLLDDRLVEAAVAAQQSSADWSKGTLAAAADPSLATMATSAKRTFTLPFDHWLRDDLAAFALERLDALADAEIGFSRKALTVLYDGFRAQHVGWRPLWALVVLGSWLERRPASA